MSHSSRGRICFVAVQEWALRRRSGNGKFPKEKRHGSRCAGDCQVCNGEKTYSPADPLVVDIDSPVSSLMMVTFAPGITPPLVSLTVPEIAPVSTCANIDRKSTRLNSSHSQISYAVFCLKKKNNIIYRRVK